MDGITPEDVRDGKGKELTGFQDIECHMIFDVKMDFTQKARFVAREDLTTTTPNVTHSSVVSRDSVQLAFLVSGLNDLDIMACNISNTCLNAPCGEKIWFQGGKDTCQDEGKVLIVDLAHHGLHSSGASLRNMLLKLCRKTLVLRLLGLIQMCIGGLLVTIDLNTVSASLFVLMTCSFCWKNQCTGSRNWALFAT